MTQKLRPFARWMSGFLCAAFGGVLLAGSAGAASRDPVLHFGPARNGPGIAEAVVISGDGGWGPIERQLGRGLSAARVDVVGIDSRNEFTRARSPARIAAYIEALGRHPGPLVLVGYSFGADLIPLVWPSLDASTRARITSIVLIAPTHDGSTFVDPTNIYSPDLMPMVLLAERHGSLPKTRVLCIFGEEERISGYSSCPTKAMHRARRLEVAGGHDLGGQIGVIADLIGDIVEQDLLLDRTDPDDRRRPRPRVRER